MSDKENDAMSGSDDDNNNDDWTDDKDGDVVVDDIERIRNNDPSFHSYNKAFLFSERDASKLADALKGNTHLKELSIYFYTSNVNDRKWAEGLASALENARLTRLCLEWSDMYSEEVDSYIPLCLIGAARQSPTIQHLEVFMVEEEGIDKIARCMAHLQSLELTGEFVAGDIELLCEGLQRTSTLTSLILIDSQIGSANDLRQLSQALADNTSITSLRLLCCSMNDDCVKEFVEHWRHDSQIHTLAFTHANIKTEGAMLLVKAASSHPALESLSMRSNHIGYEGLASIALELPNLVLKSLDMASCATTLHDRWNNHLSEKAVLVGGLIAQGVSANTHLVEIDVSNNGFDDAEQGVEEALAFYTLRNKYGPLIVSEMHLPASVWCHCFAKNGHNASFIFHFLREQPMLWHVCCKYKRQRTH